ncbi:MAG: 7-carboxy-7-deazaguanine synthase QueE [Alphaproteobacteria bacterium]|nr:MAG: 7-carboxy-7-deazaguanine synthase QueE [Alphaproteobacteria bacterium]TAF13163.1 MAG: 7-carboxy-7-deazaguanine synthase QueE [Alphaproteobacteria bacterium]TAF39890.1 MAG: 7-carboxy-7-deazaguanine synthase QueE [Alphaproteobacteria bacterium]TAF75786.1 MAG: 7-carboxy-7-deazaguanine synthase QueE [Alphaproteobacteria bacterium]
MFGSNPKRPPIHGDGTMLDVQEIFPTFQGEGPFTGRNAVFIRLGGCNLACTFCDTEFESYHAMALEQIMIRTHALAQRMIAPLVVISGGEPLRQPIEPLCRALLDAGMTVQIETNGTLFRPLPSEVHIICSPKAPSGTYGIIRHDLLERCTALKFIISATNPAYSDVPDVGQSSLGRTIPIYVQPMDEYDDHKNAQNFAHTVALARKGGYVLGMQLHKIFGVA